MTRISEQQLSERLASIAAKPGAELSGLLVAVIQDDRIVYEQAIGRAYIDHTDPTRDKPVSADHLFRVASISKSVVGLAAMQAVSQGRLDLDRDVSDYLGFTLRNPTWPDQAITARMLLSHTSSLRDGETYSLPLGASLSEFFTPGGRGWDDGVHFASAANSAANSAAAEQVRLAPGRYFTYCNLGFGVLGTILEAVSGQRFDRLIKSNILEPAGIGGSFNINLLDEQTFARLSPIYRKQRDGEYHPEGIWTAQVDDHRGHRPVLPCPALPGLGPAELDSYRPGSNASFFSPQGGLRASLRDLTRLTRLFINRGCIDGTHVVPPEAVDQMMTPTWTYDPALANGSCYYGLTRESGLGLMHTTDSFDDEGGDRLLPEPGGPRLWVHHADAYGLLGGLLVNPVSRCGFCYLLTGSAADPESLRGRHSSYFLWEEELQEAVLSWLPALSAG